VTARGLRWIFLAIFIGYSVGRLGAQETNQPRAALPVINSNAAPADLVSSAERKWSWKPTSLAWNSLTNALACTNGLRGDFSNMFTSYFGPNGLGKRNPNFWLRHFKGWPAYAVWNNSNTNMWPTNGARSDGHGATFQQHGVMVTPEHILTSGHTPLWSNTWVAFVDMSNQVVFRKVVDYFYESSCFPSVTNNATTKLPSPPWSDYYIGLLDRPVPESIGFVPIVPTNWLTWFDAPFLNTKGANPEYPVPLYVLNCQHRTPVLQDLTYLQCVSGGRYLYYDEITLPHWKDHNFFTGGDSGSPQFFALAGELCLANIVSCNINFIGGSGLFDPAHQQASINAAMRDLSLRNRRTKIYTLTAKDLSKYPTYDRTYKCPP
jgi:hypothetical protein